MKKIVLVFSLFMAGYSISALGRGSELTVETPHLIVRNTTGKLTLEHLKRFAEQAQETLNKILTFWSADPGVNQWGKIRIYLDPPRREVYSSVFYWDQEGSRRIRVVRVFGVEAAPQMMAHKLTSALFPQKDKLIRNMMGILTEAQVGNRLTFPSCGFGSDPWVSAFLKLKSYIPIHQLGPDHASWGMEEDGKGKLSIHDKARQHRAYAEAGSFSAYLFLTYGVNKIKQLQRFSQKKDRPWQDVFGIGLEELEANWLKSLKDSEKAREDDVSVVRKLFQNAPSNACAEAQLLVTRKQ
jgi:hypothetical protein